MQLTFSIAILQVTTSVAIMQVLMFYCNYVGGTFCDTYVMLVDLIAVMKVTFCWNYEVRAFCNTYTSENFCSKYVGDTFY